MKEYIKINQRVYDDLAKEYALRRDNVSCYSESTEYLGYSLLKHAPENRPLYVMDVGPGSGQILKYYEDNGCRTIGVELSSAMCQLCREQSPNSIIINNNINDLEFPDNQFDLIYMGALIHLFPLNDAQILLKKVWSWLKYSGLIFINTTYHSESQEGFYLKEDYLENTYRFRRYWKEDEFINFIIDSGFSIIEKLYTDERDRNKKWVALIGKKEKAE